MIAGGILIVVFGFGLRRRQSGHRREPAAGGFFANGFGGCGCFSIVMFAFGGIEIIGVTAGEAENPKKVVPAAINTVPVRILLFYVCTLGILMMIYPWNEIGTEGGPFVQIFDNLGIPAAAHILNAVVITAAISAINSEIFRGRPHDVRSGPARPRPGILREDLPQRRALDDGVGHGHRVAGWRIAQCRSGRSGRR